MKPLQDSYHINFESGNENTCRRIIIKSFATKEERDEFYELEKQKMMSRIAGYRVIFSSKIWDGKKLKTKTEHTFNNNPSVEPRYY